MLLKRHSRDRVKAKTVIIRTSQMLKNMNDSSAGILTYTILDFRLWSSRLCLSHNLKPKVANLKSAYSCGTAPDSHQTFPVTSSGCSPLEPIRWSISASKAPHSISSSFFCKALPRSHRDPPTKRCSLHHFINSKSHLELMFSIRTVTFGRRDWLS